MRSNKKGFTIVELVIVIAVIAILAAVLIPTIAGLVKKANISADQQAVVQMNKILAADASNPASADAAVAVLIKNGYNDDLSTYYKDYTLAWVKAENTIVLVENGKVVYPTKLADAAFEEIKPLADKVESADALVGALTDGKVVFVGADITSDDGLYTENAGEYAVNLGGNVLNSNDYIGSWVDGGKLVISNGVIASSNSTIGVYADEGGIVELNNVQVNAAAGANPLQCYGGTMVLNNVTAAQSGNADVAWYNSVIQVINNITYPEKDPVTNKHVIYGEQANLTVESGMYSGKKAIQISAPGGNVTINGGIFNGSEYVINADFAPQNYTMEEGKTFESKIIINDGYFTGSIKISAATVLEINGGDFTCNDDTAEIIKAHVTAGKTVTINGDAYTAE